MPTLNHTAFPEKVIDGTKRRSIRAKRKRGEFKVNKPIYHFSGLRTKACKRILDSVCEAVRDIKIFFIPETNCHSVIVDGLVLDDLEINALATSDGFESVQAFFDYFTLGKCKRLRKEFHGNIVDWKPLEELWK